MPHPTDIWERGNRKEIWDRYCSFLDLNVDEFMGIQNKLLMEHISLLAKCELGKTLMGGKIPKSPDEFRSIVPLTDYSFYEPLLANKREDALPVKPRDWVCTSGTSGVRKWVPLTQGHYDVYMDISLGVLIVASSTGRGKFSIRSRDKFFAAAPPPPYISGYSIKEVSEIYGFQLLPPMDEEYELSDLPTRSARGFKMALESGMDIVFALPSVMVRVGEQLGQRRKSSQGRPPLRMLFRLLKGTIRSRLAGRPLMPKDLWKLKFCYVAGMDLAAFKERIIRYWGSDPYEMYAQTEFLGMPAVQSWTHKAMTPQPYLGFFEFIPESESIKSLNDPKYQPSTCLLNELQAGNSYEVVFTNFYGGVFARYRPKDMITIVALEDSETGIRLPQWLFKGRADRLIDLGGFTRIDERTIWLAIEDAKLKYEEWMASKEADKKHPIIHIYISSDTKEDQELMEARLHASLKKHDPSYAELEDELGWKPLRLTLLPLGVFERWQKERVAAGADPAFVKEQRMQPSPEAVQRILELAKG